MALVSTGATLKLALDAGAQLKTAGRQVSVYSLPWLKPITRDFLAPLSKYARLVALEEPVAEGGLAGVLRENLDPAVRVISLGVTEDAADKVGSQDYLRNLSDLTVQKAIDVLPSS